MGENYKVRGMIIGGGWSGVGDKLGPSLGEAWGNGKSEEQCLRLMTLNCIIHHSYP